MICVAARIFDLLFIKLVLPVLSHVGRGEFLESVNVTLQCEKISKTLSGYHTALLGQIIVYRDVKSDQFGLIESVSSGPSLRRLAQSGSFIRHQRHHIIDGEGH